MIGVALRMGLVVAGVACSTASSAPVCDDGPALFGQPTEATGLTADQCGPTCSCHGETWEEPSYSAADIAGLRARVLVDPPARIDADPYASPPASGSAEAVCGVHTADDRTYTLVSYDDDRAAERAGATITHAGACGVCSSLADLAVYVEQRDLTAPVRQCGLDHLTDPREDLVACLQALGFTAPCADIWSWNTLHTRRECGGVCFAALDDPYHLPDGSLNACLQCDEDNSGPVFQAVAGRTRRNTGLASSMCRPCGEVRRIVHRY